MNDDVKQTLQFFAFKHLKPEYQEMSKHFAEVAVHLAYMTEADLEEERDLLQRSQATSLVTTLVGKIDRATPPNLQATKAVIKITEAGKMLTDGRSLDDVLNRLIEAKDCAVRSLIYKHQVDVFDPFA